MNDDRLQIAEEAEAQSETRPRVFFSSISFKDGTEIKLGNNDIVVFVGGNNAGKSQTLKDLESSLVEQDNFKAIAKTAFGIIGTAKSVIYLLKQHSIIERQKQSNGIYENYSGLGYSFGIWGGQIENTVKNHWQNNIKGLGPLTNIFCRRIQTETRITDSDASPLYDTLTEAPKTPIQFLYSHIKSEEKLSSCFHRTFNQDLRVDKGAGKNISLLVGEYIKPNREKEEDRTDSEYRKRLHTKMFPLQAQGDGMRSFASIILQTLANPLPSILLLDEPEAFLHPPQAKILGRILAKERPRDAQLFIATHSIDILMGLLEAAPDNLRIIRLSREGGKQSVVELNKDRISEIMRNPLLRYSNVLSGAFYKRAIICEDSSDCLFYQSLLGAMGKPVSDALFLYTNGKDRLNQLAEILRALGVPVSIIADIDILRGEKTIKDIITALGGDWESEKATRDSLEKAIEQEHSAKSPKVICTELEEGMTNLRSRKEFSMKDIKTFCAETFKKSSPWPMLKRAGKEALPKGNPRTLWKDLWGFCAENKLWIVPTGEIESFSDKGGHGPDWVEKVLEQGNLKTRPDLWKAREFISSVWDNNPGQLNILV